LRQLLIGLIIAIGACTAEKPPPVVVPSRCDVTIVALPAGQMIAVEDPLPPGSQIIAAPNDFDIAATMIGDDGSGDPTVTVRLRGDAVDRFARHTADHLGDHIAIMLNGDIITVPVIMAPIEGGEISISSGSLDADGLAGRFAPCVT
jgi:SecDF, P1 head subdomain